MSPMMTVIARGRSFFQFQFGFFPTAERAEEVEDEEDDANFSAAA